MQLSCADMSKTLRDKLSTYEKEYASYSSDKKIDIPSTVISDYNTLINKYKFCDLFKVFRYIF